MESKSEERDAKNASKTQLGQIGAKSCLEGRQSSFNDGKKIAVETNQSLKPSLKIKISSKNKDLQGRIIDQKDNDENSDEKMEGINRNEGTNTSETKSPPASEKHQITRYPRGSSPKIFVSENQSFMSDESETLSSAATLGRNLIMLGKASITESDSKNNIVDEHCVESGDIVSTTEKKSESESKNLIQVKAHDESRITESNNERTNALFNQTESFIVSKNGIEQRKKPDTTEEENDIKRRTCKESNSKIAEGVLSSLNIFEKPSGKVEGKLSSQNMHVEKNENILKNQRDHSSKQQAHNSKDFSGNVEGNKAETVATISINSRECASANSSSFLEALDEEQRRVRTRHLPAVNGFCKLEKKQVQEDLSFIKSMLKDDASLAKAKSRKGRPGSGEDSVNQQSGDLKDAEREDAVSASDDELSSEVSASGGKFFNRKHTKESKFRPSAFSLPCDDKLFAKTSSEEKSVSLFSQQLVLDGSHIPPLISPKVVTTINAFDPPRPRESVGLKKKHRLMRWEQNQDEVENDLRIYRKTVERTRQELHKAEQEQERIEIVGSHLRSHFLHQLNIMHEECEYLNENLKCSQIDCVKAAKLLTSKTRNRGGKASYVMRDVISVMKTLGTKLSKVSNQNKDTVETSSHSGKWCTSGVGGASISYAINPHLGNGWILPGDKVKTPYGSGFVVRPIGSSLLNPAGSSSYSSTRTTTVTSALKVPQIDQNQTPQRHGFGVANFSTFPTTSLNNELVPSNKSSKDKLQYSTKKRRMSTDESNLSIIPPRIVVRLNNGSLGYFDPKVITSLERPYAYSDARIGLRWKAMVETSELMGSSIEAYSSRENTLLPQKATKSPDGDQNLEDIDDELTESTNHLNRIDESNPGEDNEYFANQRDGTSSHRDIAAHGLIKIDKASSASHVGPNGVTLDKEKINARDKTIPYGSGMFPTPGLLGGILVDQPITTLEHNFHKLLSKSSGIIGKNNPNVPHAFKTWESQRFDLYKLEGKVLQLRNDVLRQRKIRLLNERTCSYGKAREKRCKILLAKMRADLHSLKERLNDELSDIGKP